MQTGSRYEGGKLTRRSPGRGCGEGIQGRQDGMAGEDAADTSRGLLLLSKGPWKPWKETCREQGLERDRGCLLPCGQSRKLPVQAASSGCWPGPGACNSCVPTIGSLGPLTPIDILST